MRNIGVGCLIVLLVFLFLGLSCMRGCFRYRRYHRYYGAAITFRREARSMGMGSDLRLVRVTFHPIENGCGGGLARSSSTLASLRLVPNAHPKRNHSNCARILQGASV
jgi:hypothetical protein